MSLTPESSQEPNILSKVASVVGLLGAALFFTGWIYRWSYFYFFQLEVTTLDLPVQSFFIVPLQVFFADNWSILKAVVSLLFIATAIHLTLWLSHTIGDAIIKKIEKWQPPRTTQTQKRRRSWLSRLITSLTEFSSAQFNSIRFLRSLFDEVVIVFWVLIILYWLSRWQGIADAQRDAGPNSTLPVVTLVMPENRLALGRKLEDEFLDPSLKGYRIIGDRNLFDNILGQEQTDLSNSEKPIVWRLLMERGGWLYLFPALANTNNPNDRPPVLAIQTSTLGEQMLILSPEVSKPRSR